ncbi:MAG: DUF456 domain-containing protein [Candidatus Hydrogenedentes bacterium]|nr:DUF456 domain-containing protein [Candidatus Hydrogenedentota bacterium]
MGGFIDGVVGLMDNALVATGWSLFGLAIIAGLGLDLVGLFGNWIILAAVALAWVATGFDNFGIVGLGCMAGFAVLGEVLETALAGYGARKFGGSKGSMVAALVGCLLGTIPGTAVLPIIGTLIGACLGAFVGAALYEYIKLEKKAGEALWTGLGAAIGKVGGVFAKLFCGMAMLIIAYFTYS